MTVASICGGIVDGIIRSITGSRGAFGDGVPSFLLLESGDFLLLESGDKILLES